MMKNYFSSIINKNTKQEVCGFYLNTDIDLNRSTIEIGKPLFIRYSKGSYFTHETVESISVGINGTMIETTKKLWTLRHLISYDISGGLI